jgi:hypothetical protein
MLSSIYVIVCGYPVNMGARKPAGLNRIAKVKGSKQDNQNLGVRKPKSLNRIDKIWEQVHQRA